MVPTPGGLLAAGFGTAQQLDRFLGHQQPDRAEQHDVKRIDDDVDLADRAEKTKQQRAEARSDHSTCDHHRTHAVIDALAPAMRDHPRHTGPGDLGRSRGGSNRRRHAVEDQQRRRQEASAYSEQAREHARQPAQRDDPQPVYGQVRNGQVDIHENALSQAPPR